MRISLLYEILAHHYINRKRVTLPGNMSNGRKLLILATGTSANGYWQEKRCKDKFSDYDVLIMNRSIYKMEKEIFKLRPKYFAACDSIYWGSFADTAVNKDIAQDTYRRTKEVLEKVDWEMYLVTTIHEKFDFKNDNVHIIRINASAYSTDSARDYALYKGNYCSPHIYNVAQLAIYFGITFDYKEIALVGLDFDFIKNITCDEKCRIGLTADHQYDKEGEKKISVVFDRAKKGVVNNSLLAKYLYEIADTIASFGKLSMYAEKEGCRIVNYSVDSLLDCYEKENI